jgi:hypothetical protein
MFERHFLRWFPEVISKERTLEDMCKLTSVSGQTGYAEMHFLAIITKVKQ